MHVAADQVGQRGRRAFVADVHHVRASQLVELQAQTVRQGARAVGGVVDLARIGLDIGDYFLDVAGRHVRSADERQAGARDLGHRTQLLHRVHRQLHRVRDFRDDAVDRDQYRVAVPRRLEHFLQTDQSGAAGFVVDHDRLPELLRQAFRQGAGLDVGCAAGRRADDNSHGLVRELRQGGTGCGQGGAGQGGQGKDAACEVHGCLLGVQEMKVGYLQANQAARRSGMPRTPAGRLGARPRRSSVSSALA